MGSFASEEILATLRGYLDTRARIEAGELPWGALGEFFTEDAAFVDPAWGRVDGRDGIIEFMDESMAGLEDWSFPHEWEAVDGNCVITGWQNRLPGQRPDGSFYQAPGVSRMIYAGDGKFSFEQDLLNMVHVFELMKESGWEPTTPINLPPKNPLRLCGWQP